MLKKKRADTVSSWKNKNCCPTESNSRKFTSLPRARKVHGIYALQRLFAYRLFQSLLITIHRYMPVLFLTAILSYPTLIASASSHELNLEIPAVLLTALTAKDK